MRGRRLAATTAVTVAAVAAGAVPAAAAPASARAVVLVANNWDGTVGVIEPAARKVVRTIDVVPDLEERIAEMTPDERAAFVAIRTLASEGHDELAHDVAASPDGSALYVSRGSLGDVAAFDMPQGTLRWHVDVSGYRADHLALSPDGSRLLASATTANVVDVIDTAAGTIVDRFPTGDFPHRNQFSSDGDQVYNGSVGRVVAPDEPLLDAAKGNRWLTIARAGDFEVERVIDFGRGLRSFIVLPDDRTMYAQLSFQHGLVEFDLEKERVLRTLELPMSEEAGRMRRDDYPLDSAHHGIAANGTGTKLCVAGTVSDYAAIVDRATLTSDGFAPVGDKPYWATTSPDGRDCFVANSDSDDVSVLSYQTAQEIARIPVGDHPSLLRTARLRLRPVPCHSRRCGEAPILARPNTDGPRAPSLGLVEELLASR